MYGDYETKVTANGDHYYAPRPKVMASYCADRIPLYDNTGEDVYLKIASQMFGKPIEEVTPEQRSDAKRRSLMMMYGASQFTIDYKWQKLRGNKFRKARRICKRTKRKFPNAK